MSAPSGGATELDDAEPRSVVGASAGARPAAHTRHAVRGSPMGGIKAACASQHPSLLTGATPPAGPTRPRILRRTPPPRKAAARPRDGERLRQEHPRPMRHPREKKRQSRLRLTGLSGLRPQRLAELQLNTEGAGCLQILRSLQICVRPRPAASLAAAPPRKAAAQPPDGERLHFKAPRPCNPRETTRPSRLRRRARLLGLRPQQLAELQLRTEREGCLPI